jgi:hypothetical protein
MSEPPESTLGTTIRRLRQSRGLSLRDLAGLMGQFGCPLDYSQLSRIENGAGTHTDNLEGIAKCLDVQVPDLFTHTQPPARNAMNRDWIAQCVVTQHYRYSRHGDAERQNDGLSLSEVEEALATGRILEQYSDTGRGESCLVAGFANGGKPIHVVCGRMNDWMVVVTVYIPTPPKFKTPFERG